MIALLLAAALSVNCAAESIASGPVSVSGKTVFIPIEIKEASELMGFRATVVYDAAVLAEPNVHRGALTQNGLFDDSVTVSDLGSFDIVYAGTEGMSGDGSLFTLSFSLLQAEAAGTQLTVRFSDADTFDASYRPAAIPEAVISVVLTDSAPQPAAERREPTAEDLVAAVEAVRNEQPQAEVPDAAQDAAAYVAAVNEKLLALTGTEAAYSDATVLDAAYVQAKQEVFADAAVKSVDSGAITQAIAEALQSVDAAEVNAVPAEKQAEFVQAVEDRLAQHAPDLPLVSQALSPAEAAQAIGTLEAKNRQTAESGAEVPQAKTAPRTIWIAAVCAAGAIIILGAGALLIKKQRKHKEEVTE